MRADPSANTAHLRGEGKQQSAAIKLTMRQAANHWPQACMLLNPKPCMPLNNHEL